MCRLQTFRFIALLVVSFLAQPLFAESDDHTQNALVTKGISDAQVVQTPLSLEQCIDIALKNNPDIARKRWNTETAMAQESIAQGQLLPQISAVGGYTQYMDDRLITPRRSGGQEVLGFADEVVSGNLVLSVPLYTGGRLKNEVEAAELVTQSAKHQHRRSRRELVFNVSNVFYAMLGREAVIDSLVFSQMTLDEHRKRVAELFDAQKAARVDLLRTEVRLADIEQRLLQERNVLNIQRFLLASLLGLDRQNNLFQIEGELTLADVPVDLDSSFARAFNSRQDYQSLRSQTAAQQKRVNLAKAGRLPSVSLRASYGNQWSADSSLSNEAGDVGVFAMIPLFEGGRISARVRRERSRLMVQKEALRKLGLQIKLELETAVSNIKSTHARIDVTQKASEQAKESLRIEREKYDLGKGAIIDVLDAQSALLDSQTNYYRALADYNTALAQFRLAVGEIE